jgi:hypothetical protein
VPLKEHEHFADLFDRNDCANGGTKASSTLCQHEVPGDDAERLLSELERERGLKGEIERLRRVIKGTSRSSHAQFHALELRLSS